MLTCLLGAIEVRSRHAAASSACFLRPNCLERTQPCLVSLATPLLSAPAHLACTTILRARGRAATANSTTQAIYMSCLPHHQSHMGVGPAWLPAALLTRADSCLACTHDWGSGGGAGCNAHGHFAAVCWGGDAKQGAAKAVRCRIVYRQLDNVSSV